jgi:hypothetical protein
MLTVRSHWSLDNILTQSNSSQRSWDPPPIHFFQLEFYTLWVWLPLKEKSTFPLLTTGSVVDLGSSAFSNPLDLERVCIKSGPGVKTLDTGSATFRELINNLFAWRLNFLMQIRIRVTGSRVWCLFDPESGIKHLGSAGSATLRQTNKTIQLQSFKLASKLNCNHLLNTNIKTKSSLQPSNKNYVPTLYQQWYMEINSIHKSRRDWM